MRNRNTEAVTEVSATEVVVPVVEQNFTLKQHMSHPNGRTSYTIPGVSGNLVIFNSLFAGGIAPPELTLNVAVQSPVAKVDKSAEKAAKLEEKAIKAAAKLEETKRKLEERAAKAQAVLDAAKTKVAETAGTVEASA